MQQDKKDGKWLIWLSVILTAIYIIGDMAGLWGPEPVPAYIEYLGPLQP